MKPQIIINADDFGYCKERNEGIVYLFQKKRISSVSLLLNQEGTSEAISHIKNLNICAGLHFNITEGTPICPPDQIPSLVSQETGEFLGKFKIFELLKNENENLINEKDIEKELEYQILKFIEKVGKAPSHIDGHNHVHIFPKISKVISQILPKFNIKKVRISEEYFEKDFQSNNDLPKNQDFLSFISFQSKKSREVYLKNEIISTNQFMGLGYFQKDISEMISFLETFLKNKENKNIEFMVHPGYSQKKGKGDSFSYSEERELELKNLDNEKWNLFLDENFKLVSWDQFESK